MLQYGFKVKKMINRSKIKATVALPTWGNKDIIWLPMEGLCRQKTKFLWELIIHECGSATGEKFFQSYSKRLKRAGCVKVTYMNSPIRLALSQKWKIMAKRARGEYFCLQASDDYPPPQRLQAVIDAKSQWYSCRYYYGYHLLLGKMIEYDSGLSERPSGRWKAGYHIAIKTALMRKVSNEKVYENVDNHLRRCIRPIKIFVDQKKYAGISTTGANTLTKKRTLSFISAGKWKSVFKNISLTLQSIGIPPDVIKMLEEWKNKKTRRQNKKVTQAHVGEGVLSFKDRFLTKFNLKGYHDKNAPLVIFGMYLIDDSFKVYQEHRGELVVVWCGSDGLKLNEKRANIVLSRYAIHYAMSKFLSDDLSKWGIPHDILPVCPTSVDIKLHPRGDKMYFYCGSEAKKEFYGYSIAKEVEKRTGIKIIFANHQSYSREKLMDVYKDCFLALRLTRHDGLPNTVVEMGLMGRRSIYNGGTPQSIPWENVDDICKNVMAEYESRHEPNEFISWDMKNYIDIGNKWLSV